MLGAIDDTHPAFSDPFQHKIVAQNQGVEFVVQQDPGLIVRDLSTANKDAHIRWLLASILYGAWINGTIAQNTYAAFIRIGLDTPRRILRARWTVLVDPVMRDGGCVRYDGRKSTQVLHDCETLLRHYGGDLMRLHDAAKGPRDLEDCLCAFYGVGPVTANIFLRELRPNWPMADPAPLQVGKTVARRLDVDLRRYRRKSLVFARAEAGLLRLQRTAR